MCCLSWFLKAPIFSVPRFSSIGCVLVGHTKKPKQGDQLEKYCLPFLPFKYVTSKQYIVFRFSHSSTLQANNILSSVSPVQERYKQTIYELPRQTKKN